MTRLHDVRRDFRHWSDRRQITHHGVVATSHLAEVAPTDWTMLRAIARHALSVSGPQPLRHPSSDQYWVVECSAIRLSGYLSSGELTIDIDIPDDTLDDQDVVVRLSFDDGLEPIVVPWLELELALEPAPRMR